MRKRKKLSSQELICKLAGGIFSAFGLISLMISIFFGIKSGLFLLQADSTAARLTRYQHDGSPVSYSGGGYYLAYTVNDQEYINVKLSYSSSSHREGQEITVYYNPKNPGEAKPLMGTFFGVLLSLPFAIAFLSIGLPFLLLGRKAKKTKEFLLSAGRRLNTEITDISQNTKLRVNGRSPYNIECSYQDFATGQTYLFRSENLWFNPENMITEKEISVYIDPGNMKRYYVDVRRYQDLAVDYR